MKSLIIVLLLFLFTTQNITSGEKPRAPFIVLKINGKIYKSGDKIPVRAGERITVEAILMGGRRDYCSNPQKYANMGKRTVIESFGENGLSFSINGGQFTGEWTLSEETAQFSSINEVKITPLGKGNIQREVLVELPQSGFSEIYLKVSSKTKWHYVRHTPAGVSEKEDTNQASATFNLVIDETGISNDENKDNNSEINKDEDQKDNDTLKFNDNLPVWYSSRNIIARGEQDFTIRNELNEVQKFYNLIEKYLLNNEYKRAEQQIGNLKTYVGEVKRAIAEAKAKNQEYKCQVTFVGLPTEIPMKDFNKAEQLADLYKKRFYVCQANVSRINDMLLNYQTSFSANILKSVIKNYINWGSGLPTGYENFLTLHDPDNILGVIDLPRTVMGWYQDAESDASILKNQAQTIKKLSELREFYLERMTNYVSERKKLQEIFNNLAYAKQKDEELNNFFSNLGWAKFKPKN